MQTPHLKSANFCFYPGSNAPPVIGADAEEMDLNALKDHVERLKSAQFGSMLDRINAEIPRV